jgi:hypothetical protein
MVRPLNSRDERQRLGIRLSMHAIVHASLTATLSIKNQAMLPVTHQGGLCSERVPSLTIHIEDRLGVGEPTEWSIEKERCQWHVQRKQVVHCERLVERWGWCWCYERPHRG